MCTRTVNVIGGRCLLTVAPLALYADFVCRSIKICEKMVPALQAIMKAVKCYYTLFQ